MLSFITKFVCKVPFNTLYVRDMHL